MSNWHVTLKVSQQTYDEIRQKLTSAEYDRKVQENGELDMNGIALVPLDYEL